MDLKAEGGDFEGPFFSLAPGFSQVILIVAVREAV